MEVGGNTFSETDVLVIGGGPAGTAAAISAVERGLSTILLEQTAFPRPRPGETLHPGTEAVFRQLGVAESVAAEAGIRHEGIHVTWSGRCQMQLYGAGSDGPWRGYQISRSILDALLIDRAQALGVDVRQPCRAGAAIRSDNRIVGTETTSGDIRARMVIDAGGALSWASRQKIVDRLQISPRLLARYGYCRLPKSQCDENPSLVADEMHWNWLAPISNRIVNWTQIIYPNVRYSDIDRPAALDGLASIGRIRGADVTWRLAHPSARDGVITVGDAASVHDPLSSHGVLHALMSGIMAATVADTVITDSRPLTSLSAIYSAWLRDRFLADSAQLIAFYRQLSPSPPWIDEAARQLMRLN